MSKFDKLKGKWKHISPWDSDDYLALYEISGTELAPLVTGVDLNDSEEFVISEISWSNDILSFESYMPSTQRKGQNKFCLNVNGKITSEFTFTVIEELVRENT